MHSQRIRSFLLLLLTAFLCFGSGCNTTKNLKEGEYLLRRNTLKIQSDQAITRKGQLNDQLASLVVQKPNTYSALGLLPYKLWLYNFRYNKYQRDSSARAFQLKARTVEMPVIYDSTLRRRSVLNMKGYLFNQGYFYAKVTDTTKFSGKKASVIYKIETGTSYLMNEWKLDVDDSAVKKLVLESMETTQLTKNKQYTNSLLEAERSRIAGYMRNHGYYKFTQENISFKLDTVSKESFRDLDNPFESAINFVTLQNRKKAQPTLDVHIIIRRADQAFAYRTYGIGKMTIYPDFIDTSDIRNPDMIQSVVDSVTFRYHKYYVRERVILNHTFLVKNELYSQQNYDRTITRLNELGIFQYVRIVFIEDSTLPYDRPLRCVIVLNPSQKYDFTTSYEVTNASTYALGNAITVTARNRNLFKGANQLSIGLSGGIELGYNSQAPGSIFEKFFLLSKNAGINASLELPKFVSPIAAKRFSRYNTPRTIIGVGVNLLDRVDFFQLTTTTANFTYNWKQTATKTWDFSPAFVNLLRLPLITDSFQRRLDSNSFLRNSYRPNFIEGENLTFTFSDQNARRGRLGYSYVKASVEEAGSIIAALVGLSELSGSKKTDRSFQQYLKFDVDARRYVPYRRSMIAGRIMAGVGIPYNNSTTLPYIKQYFAGGPYSIRGWRVRSLGPGSWLDTNAAQSNNFIDNTGDIKLEANIEYRFDIVQLFSGAMKLNGAVFTDAGNIWLARPSTSYPGGEFAFSKLGQDIAMSSGAGARLDIGGLFVLRFDAAVPIKKPYSPKPGGWVLDELFSTKKWMGDNLIINVAIGYPF